jgi:hypothetical protein
MRFFEDIAIENQLKLALKILKNGVCNMFNLNLACSHVGSVWKRLEAGAIPGFKYSHLTISRSMRGTSVVPWKLLIVLLFPRTKSQWRRWRPDHWGGVAAGTKFSSLYSKYFGKAF